jgi:hypothetical protein
MKKSDIQNAVRTTESLAYFKGVLEPLLLRFKEKRTSQGLLVSIPIKMEFSDAEVNALYRAVGVSLDMINKGLTEVGEKVNGTSKEGSPDRSKRSTAVSARKRPRKGTR